MRTSLRQVLSRDPELEIAGELDSARNVLKVVEVQSPHLVLMDLVTCGASGVEAIGQIIQRHQRTRVMVVTEQRQAEYLIAGLRAGAHGYVVKDTTAEELLLAVRSVLRGKTYICSDVSSQVIAGYLAGGPGPVAPAGPDRITRRERQIMKLIAEGRSSWSIADSLRISERTVKSHCYNLIAKLGLPDLVALTAYAMENTPAEARNASNVPADPVMRHPLPARRH